MTNPLIQIDNLIREMNAEELADYKAMQDAVKASEAQAAAKIAARESALAKLAALGLTEEEIAAL